MLAEPRRGLVYLFLFLCGLVSYSAQAQYYLTLRKQTIAAPGRFVFVEQVVDGRPGKPPIGIVHRGLENRKTVVLFRNGLEPELTAFLQRLFPARATDIPVVFYLRQLRVAEVLNGLTEEASADIALDVYAHLPDGYHFVQSTAAHVAEREMETTSLHDDHLAQILGQCIWQLGNERWQQLDRAPALTLAQLATDKLGAQITGATTSPAILRERPRAGVYTSFNQFLTNQPDSTLSARLDTVRRRLPNPRALVLWQGVPYVRPLFKNELGQRQKAEAIWGFSDGEVLYTQHQKGFFPLVRYQDFFTFVGEAPTDIEHMQARVYAQAKPGFRMLNTVGLIDHTGEPTSYALDMRTGQAGVFPNQLQRPPTYIDTTVVYVYRGADTSSASVKIMLGNNEVGRLRPNEYLEVRWPYYARTLRLCIDLPSAAICQLLIPNPTQANYLRFTTDTPSPSKPAYQWMTMEQGEADLDAIDAVKTKNNAKP